MTLEEMLGRLVVARTAPGNTVCVGECVAYCDAPSVTIQLPDGTQTHWRADLCQVVDLEPEDVKTLMAGGLPVDEAKP